MITANNRNGIVTLARSLILGLVFMLAPLQQSFAHALEQSYVFLNVSDSALEGRIEINLYDLNKILAADLPTDGSATLDNLEPHISEIRDYLRARVALAPEGIEDKALPLTTYELHSNPLAQYFVYHFEFPDIPVEMTYVDIDYAVLFDIEPQHRGLLVIETNWKTGTFDNEALVSLIFEPGKESRQLDLSKSAVWRGFVELVGLGIHHILIGTDHILFLMALLLPSVVRRSPEGWRPLGKFRPALIYVIKVVTVFTVAHTITLSLAALNTLSMSSRIVESIIALSIAVAALDIIYPIFRHRIWIIVFAFGLFHGFGFASVLGEIGIPPKYMALSLLGFNLGVEIGQIAIVAIAFPVFYLLRKSWVYPRVVLRYGPLALIVISLYWFIERGFLIDLPAGAIVNRLMELVV